MADRTCSIDGCERKAKGRGWCGSHWRKWRLYGDPLKSFPRADPVERLLDGCREDGRGCWIPSQRPASHGYVSISAGNKGRHVYAHRLTYEYLRAEIPEGLHIDHLCRNPSCCNPWHLEPVTPLVNQNRGLAGPRLTCDNGHEWTDESTYIRPDNGNRQCNTCRRARTAARFAAINAARAKLGLTHREYAARFGLSMDAATAILDAA